MNVYVNVKSIKTGFLVTFGHFDEYHFETVNQVLDAVGEYMNKEVREASQTSLPEVQQLNG